MKHLFFFLFLLSANAASAQRTISEFINPPTEARPGTYWQWMNGNINKEGLTKDLEYMKQANYGSAMIFDTGVGIPRGPVDYNSEEWKEAILHAVMEADRLGLRLSLHNAPGYSGTGGPWIDAEHSMKQLVWTDAFAVTDKQGYLETTLSRPYAKMGFYRDAYVLAYPSLPGEAKPFASLVQSVMIEGKEIEKDKLSDNDLNSCCRLESGQSLLIKLSELFEARAATVFRGKREQPADPHDGPRDYAPMLTLESSEDGEHFTVIGNFHSIALRALDIPSTLSFAPVKARYFKITSNRGTNFAEIDLHASARLNRYAVKAITAVSPSEPDNDADKGTMADRINPNQVTDVTTQMDRNGHLRWKAPHNGKWTIVRIGYTTTGETVAAAPDSGIGLECDKFSKEGVDKHFDLFLEPLLERLRPWCGSTLEALVIDSWEAGKQNWTDSLPAYFKAQRGYSLVPYLLSVTGRIVGNTDKTERFLWDFRRTQADMFLENYVEHFKQRAARYGLSYIGEAYGDGNFKSLEMAARQDVPMSEFWTHYVYGNISTTMLAASAAHVWGKPVVACEAYTGTPFNSKFTEHPYGMKALGDYIMSAGTNRLVYHATTHQPYTGDQPGNMMTMGPFGTHFDRTSTWATHFATFNLYVARCSHLLQQGKYVADILYLKDENISSGTNNYNTVHPATPYGYRWDVIDAETLRQRASLHNGRITMPDGMNYGILVVTPIGRSTPETIRQIIRLANKGATVMLTGDKPKGYLGLDEEKDKEVKALADTLWQERPLGKGHVYIGDNLQEILNRTGIVPDFTFKAQNKDAQIHFIHRKTENEDIYFIANHRRRPEHLTVACRQTGKIPFLWNAETGETDVAIPYKKEENGTTRLTIHLQESGSVFVVFKKGAVQSSTIEEISPLPSVIHTRNGNKVFHKKDSLHSTFSLSLWAKPETYATAGRGFLLYPADRSGNEAETGIAMGQNGVRIYERRNQRNQLVMEYLHPIEGWTHLALVYNQGTPTLYLNGKQATQGKKSRYDCYPAIDVPMAEEQYAESFEGDQTKTEFYDYALSEAEIDLLVQQGLPAPHIKGKIWKELSQEWLVEFPAESKAPPAIKLSRLQSLHKHPDFHVRHFSGTAVWSKTITLADNEMDTLKNKRLFLNLGRVENMAEVRINNSIPVLLWKAPFSTDITGLLHAGENKITVKVTNLYPNRLIGDEYLPETYDYDQYGRLRHFPEWYRKGETDKRERVLFLPWKYYCADDPLLEAGLTGPVTISVLPDSSNKNTKQPQF